MKLVYSVNEASAEAGLSRSLFYKLIAAGQGPKLRKAGTRTIILRTDLEEWLRSLPTGNDPVGPGARP